MLSAALLLVELSSAPIGLITRPYTTLSTYASSQPRTAPQIKEAHWSSQPTSKQTAATPAAQVTGGARALLHCSADAQGKLTGCWVEAAEPDRRDVRTSALRLTSFYRLGANDTLKAKLSKRPGIVSLLLLFPDKQGKLPSDCNAAFGCIVEYFGARPPKGKVAPSGRMVKASQSI